MKRANVLGWCLSTAALLGACKKHGAPSVTIRQANDDVEASVRADSDTTVTIAGRVEHGSATFHFPALSFPVGAQTVDVDFETKGTHTTQTIPFTRAPVAPKLTLREPANGVVHHARCSGELCASAKQDQNVVGIDRDGRLVVEAYGPAGEKVEVDGKSITLARVDLPKVGPALVTIDLDGRAPDVAVDAVAGERPVRSFDVPFHVTADGSKDFVLSVEAGALATTLDRLLAAVENGPVLFGDPADAGPKGKPRSIYFPAFRRYVGKPGTLRELDAVAIVHDRDPVAEASTCGPYEGGATVPRVSVAREVSVYDRRTGKLTAKRVFAAPHEPCPKAWRFSTLTNSAAANIRDVASVDTIVSWSKTLVGPG